jgi:hypothetical protein
MQEQLAITLKPERVTVTAGGDQAQIVAVIQNQTSVIDSYALELTDLDPDWYTLPVKSIALFPSEQKTVNITLHAPGNLDVLAGRYDFTVRARSTAMNNRVTQASGVLFVTIPESLSLKLNRESIRGQEAKFELTISNRSKAAAAVNLTGKDPEGLLEFTFEPRQPTIPAGGSQLVEMSVRLTAGQVVLAERPFRFSVSAETTDERDRATPIDGQFVYLPGQVRMELLPARLKGIEGRFNLNVSNPGVNTMSLECLLNGKDPDDVLDILFQQKTLTLQPGTSVILPVTVRLKAGRKPELRSYPFTVSVRQGGGGANAAEIGAPVMGEFVYEPPVEFSVAVERNAAAAGMNGTQADYIVKLANPSLIGLRMSLRADDPGKALDLFFANRVDQVLLEAESAAEVQLLARLRTAPPSQEMHYPFMVTAHAVPDDGGAEQDKVATAEFVYGAAQGPILRMDLLPPQARGETAHFQLRLTSGVANPLQVVLRGRDDGTMLQYDFQPQKLELAPGAVELVDLALRPKDGRTLEADIGYSFEAIAWVPGMGTNGSTTSVGTWFYTPPAGPVEAPVTLQMTPSQIIGDTGQFQLTLANRGYDPVSVVLRGSDESEALEFLFQTPRVELQPKEVQDVSLIIRGVNGQALPGPYRYPFEVAGWVPGTVTSDAAVQYGEMIVTEAPKKAGLWTFWQRIGIAVGLVLWMALPFILDPIFRKSGHMELLSLMYQFLPALVFPLLGAAMYGQSGESVKGWRGVLAGALGFGGVLTYFLPTLIPPGTMIFGFSAMPFVYLFLLPALIIVLLA